MAWYRFDPTTAAAANSAPAPADQGRVSDPDLWFYFPSIAVNSNGDIGLGFSGSSSSTFASCYFTARKSSDSAGTTAAPFVYQSGASKYTQNRWGDYSMTSVDPNDGITFWTVQEFAAGTSGQFGTAWASFGYFSGAPAAPSGLTATPAPPNPNATADALSWTNNASYTNITFRRGTASGLKRWRVVARGPEQRVQRRLGRLPKQRPGERDDRLFVGGDVHREPFRKSAAFGQPFSVSASRVRRISIVLPIVKRRSSGR